jgi:hypothetical protein
MLERERERSKAILETGSTTLSRSESATVRVTGLWLEPRALNDWQARILGKIRILG